jgi:hypothetical protein
MPFSESPTIKAREGMRTRERKKKSHERQRTKNTETKKENRERESVRKEKGEGRVKEKQNRGEKAVAVLVGQPFYTVIVVCNCKQQVPGTRAFLSFFENRGREEDREIRNPQTKAPASPLTSSSPAPASKTRGRS